MMKAQRLFQHTSIGSGVDWRPPLTWASVENPIDSYLFSYRLGFTCIKDNCFLLDYLSVFTLTWRIDYNLSLPSSVVLPTDCSGLWFYPQTTALASGYKLIAQVRGITDR
jgi:hypothetical protein